MAANVLIKFEVDVKDIPFDAAYRSDLYRAYSTTELILRRSEARSLPVTLHATTGLEYRVCRLWTRPTRRRSSNIHASVVPLMENSDCMSIMHQH